MSSEAPESLFGQVPPDGACSVRLRLRLKRKGNSPAVVSKSLTEEAVLCEIQQSSAWRKWLEWDHGGPLDPKEPYTCKATLTWLGSDGKEIDQAVDVELGYWPAASTPSDRKRARRPDGARELGKAVRSAVPAVADMAAKVVHEGHVPVQAMADVTKKALDQLEKAYEREARRVDSAITEMANRAQGASAQPASGSGGFKTLIDGLAFLKEAKSFLN